MMKRKSLLRLTMIVALVFVCNPIPTLAASPPQQGDVLPDISLPIPEDPGHREYLGLKGEGRFKIPQIKAEVVIIEIYSMYCPHCQREARRVNALYKAIEQSSKSKGKLKVVGIGVGNSSFEVEIFRKKYDVPFPLLPDADYSIHKRLGEVRTPYFIGVRIKEGGVGEVFYSKLGGFRKADEFLELMVEESGIE